MSLNSAKLGGIAGLLALTIMVSIFVYRAFKPAIPAGAVGDPLDKIIADWNARNVPQSRRAVKLVLSDDNPAPDAALPPEPGSAAAAWLGRAAGRGLPGESAFARALQGDRDTIALTFRRMSAADRAVLLRELQRAIIAAHDARAELDIAAKGETLGPVLEAAKGLDGMERGGEKVGVNKIVAFGMNKQALNPSFLSAWPGNVRETALIYSNDSMPRTTTVLLEAGGAESRYDAAQALPDLGPAPEAAAKVVKELIDAPTMQGELDKRLTAEKLMTLKSHDGSYINAERKDDGDLQRVGEARQGPGTSAPGTDSLSMITGGKDYTGTGSSGGAAGQSGRASGSAALRWPPGDKNWCETKQTQDICAPNCPGHCGYDGKAQNSWYCNDAAGRMFGTQEACAAHCSATCASTDYRCICPKLVDYCGEFFHIDADCRDACHGQCVNASRGKDDTRPVECLCPRAEKHCRETFARSDSCRYACAGSCIETGGDGHRSECLCQTNRKHCDEGFFGQGQCAYACAGQCLPRQGSNGPYEKCLCAGSACGGSTPTEDCPYTCTGTCTPWARDPSRSDCKCN